MMTTLRRRAPEPVPYEDNLASDMLASAGPIARFWFGSNTPEHRKRTFRLAEQKVIPVGRLGGRLMASRRAPTERHRRLTEMPAEAAAAE
jgi:hypothetical protein